MSAVHRCSASKASARASSTSLRRRRASSAFSAISASQRPSASNRRWCCVRVSSTRSESDAFAASRSVFDRERALSSDAILSSASSLARTKSASHSTGAVDASHCRCSASPANRAPANLSSRSSIVRSASTNWSESSLCDFVRTLLPNSSAARCARCSALRSCSCKAATSSVEPLESASLSRLSTSSLRFTSVSTSSLMCLSFSLSLSARRSASATALSFLLSFSVAWRTWLSCSEKTLCNSRTPKRRSVHFPSLTSLARTSSRRSRTASGSSAGAFGALRRASDDAVPRSSAARADACASRRAADAVAVRSSPSDDECRLRVAECSRPDDDECSRPRAARRRRPDGSSSSSSSSDDDVRPDRTRPAAAARLSDGSAKRRPVRGASPLVALPRCSSCASGSLPLPQPWRPLRALRGSSRSLPLVGVLRPWRPRRLRDSGDADAPDESSRRARRVLLETRRAPPTVADASFGPRPVKRLRSGDESTNRPFSSGTGPRGVGPS